MGDETAPRLLLLTPAGSYRCADFLAAARRMRLKVTVASDRSPIPGLDTPGSVLRVDLEPLGEGLSQILAHAGQYPVDAVVGTEDAVSELAAAAARALGCLHASQEGVRLASDKHRFRQRLVQAGLPAPRFELVHLSGDLRSAARAMSYPCVLKPLHLSGSRGVIRADDGQGFLDAAQRIRRLLGSLDTLTSRRQRENVLVEAFVPGPEVALEGLLVDGSLKLLALFDKPDPLDGPFFEETLFITPSRHPPARQRQILESVEQAARALGLSQGPVHAELRLNSHCDHDGDGVSLLELAPRSIGGLCARSLRFTPDMGEEELILRHALGWPVHNFTREGRASGVMMLPIPAAGVLASVNGLQAAREIPGIDDVVISIGCGERLVPLPEGDRYLGFIFASAEIAQQVEQALRRAHACLDVVLQES